MKLPVRFFLLLTVPTDEARLQLTIKTPCAQDLLPRICNSCSSKQQHGTVFFLIMVMIAIQQWLFSTVIQEHKQIKKQFRQL